MRKGKSSASRDYPPCYIDTKRGGKDSASLLCNITHQWLCLWEKIWPNVLQWQEKQHGLGPSAAGTDPGEDVYIQFLKDFGAAEFVGVLTTSQKESAALG